MSLFSALIPEKSRYRHMRLMEFEGWPARPPSIGFDTDVIIDCDPKLPFAAEISLCRLNANVTEQELDPLQFTAGHVT